MAASVYETSNAPVENLKKTVYRQTLSTIYAHEIIGLKLMLSISGLLYDALEVFRIITTQAVLDTYT